MPDTLQKNYKDALTHPVFKTIATASEELGLSSYVIGGFVRDFLLKRGNAKDIDVVTIGNGIALAKKVANKIKEPRIPANGGSNTSNTTRIIKNTSLQDPCFGGSFS